VRLLATTLRIGGENPLSSLQRRRDGKRRSQYLLAAKKAFAEQYRDKKCASACEDSNEKPGCKKEPADRSLCQRGNDKAEGVRESPNFIHAVVVISSREKGESP